MKHDSRPVQISQFLTLLGIGLRYDFHRRLGNSIDKREGVMEQRVASLMCRRILDRYRLSVEVEGAHNVEGIERRYCIVSNHLSYLDWVIHLAHFPTAPAFIAKKELTFYPVIGPYLKSRGVMIDRKAAMGARRAISAAADANVPWPILIFPEGTRSADGETKEFRRGGLTVIASTGMPMVPTVLLGSHEAYPRKARTIRPGRRMKLVILEPVDPTTFSDAGALVDHLQGLVKETYDRRRPEILEPGDRKSLEAAKDGDD